MTTFRNRVQLIGNLGMNPEIVNFDSGSKIAKFTLATNYKTNAGKDNEKTITDWHNIVGWGKLADYAQKYLEKGQKISLEGRLTYRKYEDKNNQPRIVTEIVLDSIEMHGKKTS